MNKSVAKRLIQSIGIQKGRARPLAEPSEGTAHPEGSPHPRKRKSCPVLQGLIQNPAPWVIVFFALQMSGCLPEKKDAVIRPAPKDAGAGLLFHASFDRGARAETAMGSDLPSAAEYGGQYNHTETAGQRVPGVFGQAYVGVGKPQPGYYDALGNFLAARGTLAFHIRTKDKPYGLELFDLYVTGYYNYYWGLYARCLEDNNGISAWFPNEVYRPIVLYGGKKVSLQDGQWHHVAIAWDQAYGVNLFFDGRPAASNWGQVSWFSRGVNPGFFLFGYLDPDTAYDELYIFDRPLTAEQIAQLAAKNIAPRSADLAAVPFDAAHRRNRLKELSWEYSDAAMPMVQLGPDAGGAFTIRQVVPLTAQAVKKTFGEVIDGKLGSGWPPIYNYEFNKGNGLHVELGEPYDYVTIEGNFQGAVYGEHRLETSGAKPLAYIQSKEFMYRRKLDVPRPPGWLSFFKGEMEDKGALPDKELVTTSRICEVNFFQVGGGAPTNAWTLRYYLGPASLSVGTAALGVEFSGRYEPGDRAALVLSRQAPAEPGGQAVAGLRYHHLIVPPLTADTPLKGVRLALCLRGTMPDNTLRVELRDAILPVRRICAVDIGLTGLDPREPRLLDLTLDLSDRIVPRDKPLWLTLCLKNDVDLLWQGAGQNSFLELLTGPLAESLPEFCRTELTFVKSQFSGLSEARDWCSYREPERALTDRVKGARELFDPLTFLWKIDPNNPKVRALWCWTHKFLEDTSPVKPTPVAGCENAPRWALLQRELLAGCRNILYWWFDNRQAPNGEFGDAWGDDTDLCDNFAKMIFLGDPGNRLRDAVTKVADGVYAAGLIERGINVSTADNLHAYEEGVNVACAMSLVAYGNPKYLERLMESAKTVEEYLTAKDVKGRRRFRSNIFGAKEVRDKGKYGCDEPGNALFCHPALSLAYYSHNPRSLRFLQEWADGWLAIYTEFAEPEKNKFPIKTLLDGTVLDWHTYIGSGSYGYVDLYIALYAMTEQQRYGNIARYFVGAPFPGGSTRPFKWENIWYYPAPELIDRDKHRQDLILWAEAADLRCPFKDNIGLEAMRRYVKWEVTGDEQAVYDGLDICLRNIRALYDAYTWGEPIDDRIWLPDHPIVMMTQGDMSHERDQLWPRHYVSYQGLSDFAAWVREKSDTSLKIWIYSFAPQEEKGIIRVWRTPLGEYEMRWGEDKGMNGLPDGGETRIVALHHSAAIPLVVPSRKLCALSLRLLKKSDENFWLRPDLGISSDDVRRTADGGLAVTVHNLGNSAATNVVIRLLDNKKNKIAEKILSSLEAPLDLHPRKAEVIFNKITNDVISIALDPDNKIPELNEENNDIE